MGYKATELQIENLFSKNISYIVPRYQRGYVWDKKNWDDLIRDIFNGYKFELDYSHFLGTFVFEEKYKDNSKDIDYYHIIDGQQRLTTIQIMIFALIYLIKKHLLNAKTDENAEIRDVLFSRIAVLQEYISFRDRVEPLKRKAKIINGLDSFELLANESVKQLSEINSINIQVYEDLKVDSISNCFQYIVKFLNDNVLDSNNFEESLLNFQNALLRINIITVTSSNQNEVLNLFEVLNARGLYLKQIELLKNFIFRKITSGPIRDSVKIDWEKMNDLLYDNEIDPDDFLFHFMRSYYSISGLQKVNIYQSLKDEEYKNNYEKADELYQNIIKSYKHYVDICISKSDIKKEIYVFKYFQIKKNKQIRSLLLSLKIKLVCKEINQTQYCDFITDILKFFIGFNLSQHSSNKIDSYISEFSHGIYRAANYAEVKLNMTLLFTKLNDYYPSKEELINKLKEIQYSNKNKKGNINSAFLSFLLYPIYELEQSEVNIENLQKSFNIEHIIPDDKVIKTTWSLGNLMLLSKKMNNKLKNSSYNIKRDILLKSDYSYNRNFAVKYINFDVSNIQERTDEIVTSILNNIYLDLANIDEILKNDSKYIDVKDFIKNTMGNNSESLEVLYKRGVKGFQEYMRNNDSINKEVVDEFQLLL